MHDLNISASGATPASQTLEGADLYVGFVGALGADVDRLSREMGKVLKRVRYEVEEIAVSALLGQVEGWDEEISVQEAARGAWIDALNRFRERLKNRGAMASLAIQEVANLRDDEERRGHSRRAYLIRTLKTPEEVALLREVYGKSFVAIGAYASKEERAHSLHGMMLKAGISASEAKTLVHELLQREEREGEKPFGQSLEATFPLADFFVEAGEDDETLLAALNRIVELLFGNLFHAPTRDEFGMFHAVSAGVRSTSLARQVGAAICTPEGELVALGCNDVPKAGGGLYWEGDEGDSRDHLRGFDFNDQMKSLFIRDLLRRLQQSGWLGKRFSGLDDAGLMEEAMQPDSLLRHSELMKMIEYGRSVHAEMAALMDAAKRGIAVEGCTLYTTTFPCHNCAKHILASGIKRVVYLEPYPKSFAKVLYADSVWVKGEENEASPSGIRFEPFVGISFRQYFSLFSTGGVERKVNGSLSAWVAERASLRAFDHHAACLAREEAAIEQLHRDFAREKLSFLEE